SQLDLLSMSIFIGFPTSFTLLALGFVFFFSSRRRHTRFKCDWSSDVCSSDLRIARSRPKGATELEMRLTRFPMLPIPIKVRGGAPLIADCETLHAPFSLGPFSDYCRCLTFEL